MCMYVYVSEKYVREKTDIMNDSVYYVLHISEIYIYFRI